jgi:hypothetical protein
MTQPTYGPFHVKCPPLDATDALPSCWAPIKPARAQLNRDGAICVAVAAINCARGLDLHGVYEVDMLELALKSANIDNIPDHYNKRYGLLLAPTMNALAIELDGRTWCSVVREDLEAWVLTKAPAVVLLNWQFHTKAWVGWGKYMARKIPIIGRQNHAVTVIGFNPAVRKSIFSRSTTPAFLIVDPMKPSQLVWIAKGDLITNMYDGAAFMP